MLSYIVVRLLLGSSCGIPGGCYGVEKGAPTASTSIAGIVLYVLCDGITAVARTCRVVVTMVARIFQVVARAFGKREEGGGGVPNLCACAAVLICYLRILIGHIL